MSCEKCDSEEGCSGCGNCKEHCSCGEKDSEEKEEDKKEE